MSTSTSENASIVRTLFDLFQGTSSVNSTLALKKRLRVGAYKQHLFTYTFCLHTYRYETLDADDIKAVIEGRDPPAAAKKYAEKNSGFVSDHTVLERESTRMQVFFVRPCISIRRSVRMSVR